MATSQTPPSSGPPRVQVDVLMWVRRNLFSSWSNTLLTIVTFGLLYVIISRLVNWLLFQADWTIVLVNLRLLLVGTYPVEQTWRVWGCVALACTMIGVSWGVWPRVIGKVGLAYGLVLGVLAALPFFALDQRLWLASATGLLFGGWLLARQLMRGSAAPRLARWTGIGWIVLLIVVLVLLVGFEPLLPLTDTRDWGGLLLTFVLAITAIVFSFPLGVLLAVGRRSRLPVVSGCCTVYIEVLRGVPLITVLFTFLIMMPLFVPGGENIDNVIRAIVGFTLFTAAYIAENVRGGLQAIPRGQSEAAQALGLNPLLTLVFIILPQALRIVIPANVNQFVSLFKDTSLVIVVGGGMLELLGRARNITNQPEFLGQWLEPLAFAALVFWIFAYSLTYVSRNLEEQLHVGSN